MKNEQRLKSRRSFALACPGIFFTLAFWSLGLLLGTATYFVVQVPSSDESEVVKHIISRVPVTSLSVQKSPHCPEGSRLLFSLTVPGVPSSSCFRPLADAPFVEVASGWWKCKSGLFSDFQNFEESRTSVMWNLGDAFVCAKQAAFALEDFVYSVSAQASVQSKIYFPRSKPL